ncbi:MAG TPA: GatB/YqeY domain-containing protein [Solirubrobacteraceae bacterium]|jgi:hypothetical protein|nr:GatB/YqeY domain-containing protein [Solirubrobacteraceae bacterium]
MTLAEAIKGDLVTAMKAGERERVGALRLVLSELQKAAKEGDGDEQAVMRRERKRRLDAASAFRDAGRDELAEAEQREATLIEGYLPAELTDEQLGALVAQAVSESGAQSPADMGRAMALAMKAVDGRADGRRVSEHVRALLTA